MTPEGKVKHKLDAILKAVGVYYHKPVLNGMGKPSLDYICCHKGRFFAIEAKAPGKKPTERQVQTIAEMEKAGGKVFVVDGIEAAMVLAEWLEGV